MDVGAADELLKQTVARSPPPQAPGNEMFPCSLLCLLDFISFLHFPSGKEAVPQLEQNNLGTKKMWFSW